MDKITTTQLNGLLNDYIGTVRNKNEQHQRLEEDLNHFVKCVANYLRVSNRNAILIGDKDQGIGVCQNEEYNLHGILTRAILEGYMESFADILKEATSRMQETIKTYFA